MEKFGKPIVSTSANISTEELPNQFSKISTEIKKPEMKNKVKKNIKKKPTIEIKTKDKKGKNK